jgi:hypothetical protein
MFDPRTDQAEFVEVYNRSERMVELKNLILVRADASGVTRSFSDQQPLSYWLFPQSYAVFTGDYKLFAKAWPLADPAIVAARPDMPSLTNEESQMILMDRNQKQLDAVTYSPGWHYPYLEEKKGVSLERIDPDLPGTDRDNWFSASAATGGSTPGSKNSSSLNPQVTSSQYFSMEPAIGYQEVQSDRIQLAVSFNFGNPGWFLSMHIFNSNGQLIREIFPFGMAPVKGAVCWDGLDTAQRQVPEGIYLLVADYYHPSGKKGRWKRACAIMRTY